ncbi:hypothetical protein SAMN04488118_10821 [Epibacterium ulvae]|uniref:Uncharacterized protein n=1 Tax=Epibacterium ulvae TaxID=1156985 RepID=A0A1G5R445_9RHOB|nr:hypothetical protein SAMN04488118_10821 [Epibacterium ulvae]
MSRAPPLFYDLMCRKQSLFVSMVYVRGRGAIKQVETRLVALNATALPRAASKCLL